MDVNEYDRLSNFTSTGRYNERFIDGIISFAHVPVNVTDYKVRCKTGKI